MIDASERCEWATAFGVADEQIDRDHFISHILDALATSSLELRFFGCTALSRTVLEGSRLSEEIDLLAPRARDTLGSLEELIPRALRREFPDVMWRDGGDEGDGHVARLSAPGIQPIKVYLGRDGPNTEAWDFTESRVNLRYSDLPHHAVFACPTLDTFAAMKLVAWYDRHAPRDLFDLAGLAGHPDLDVDAVTAVLRRKVGHGLIDAELRRVPQVVERAWATELGAQTGRLPTAQECLMRAGRVFLDRSD